MAPTEASAQSGISSDYGRASGRYGPRLVHLLAHSRFRKFPHLQPSPHHEKPLYTMVDQLAAWVAALKPLRQAAADKPL